MKGYPAFLNTKQDYEYVRMNFPKEVWKKDFQALLENVYEWFFTNIIPEGEQGIEDETHRIKVDNETGVRSQYAYMFNSNCKLIQLGYTPEEVEGFLK